MKKKLKTNNHVLNLRQNRSVLKNEDNKLKNVTSTVKTRRIINTSIGVNINNLVKKNNDIPTITFSKSNSKASMAGKKNVKALMPNKTNFRSTRMSTTIETVTK